MATDFKLPFLGDGISAATIVKVMVKPGDRVARGQAVLEVETDKASVEVPSDVEGTVSNVSVQAGAKVNVGQVVMTVEGTSAGASAPAPRPAPAAAPSPAPAVTAAAPRPAPSPAPAPAAAAVARPAPAAAPPAPVAAPPAPAASAGAATPAPVPSVIQRELVAAAPSVRRLARELGIDITQVPGSGPGGRITADDVKGFSRRTNIDVAGFGAAVAPALAAPSLPDFSKWGEVEHISMSGVRKKTAEHMAYCWATIPHVTQFDKANIEDLETLRRNFGKKAEAAGGKLTVTAILLKVVASALKVFPQFNASVDPASSVLIYKKFINIGVAVDTDRGLLVPVVRNVDKKNIIDLAVELSGVAERARTKKTTLEEMQGGTFTITNLGGVGGTAFTPIVNAPEVAILGVARTQVEPVWTGERFEPRRMLPLALSYDHRIIDGADGARFLRWIVEALEQPFLLSLEG